MPPSCGGIKFSAMRLALFPACFNDALFPRTAVATVRLLEKLGQEVVVPLGQTCCGQIHFNTGYRKEAFRLLCRFLEVFSDGVHVQAIVAPSASCVAMVREQYPELLGWARDRGLVGGKRSERLGRSLERVAGRTFELSEFLVRELGVVDVGARFPFRVALHPTCHSIRGIDVGDAPVRLLTAVDGLELVDLERAEECCGFGGTFAVKNADTSLAMMEDKLRSVRESGAQVLTAVDNSCLMHLAGGMRRGGWPGEVRVLHLAEILVGGGERGLGGVQGVGSPGEGRARGESMAPGDEGGRL